MATHKVVTHDQEVIIEKMNFLCQIGKGDSQEMENLESMLAKIMDEKAGE